MTGNLNPYGFFVSGFIDSGPVVPIQPPNTLLQITKKKFVSITFPGPTKELHQPFLLLIGFFVSYKIPQILGNRIALQDNADISVSGANSGGEILIGGNYLGKGPEPNASATVILGAVAPSKANLFPLSETTVTFIISVILLTILVFFSVVKLPERVNEPVSRGFNCLLSSKAIFFLSQFFPTRFHRA